MAENTEALLEPWRAEALAEIEGWDFSAIADRHYEDTPPWAYENLARPVLRGAGSALDMGTGGGEMLLGLLDAPCRGTRSRPGVGRAEHPCRTTEPEPAGHRRGGVRR